MKNSFLPLVMFFLVYQFLAIPQQRESLRKNKPNRLELNAGQQKTIERKIDIQNAELKDSKSNNLSSVSDLAEFRKLPYQDPAISYYEVTPVALSNGNIMMIWSSWDVVSFSDDTLFCATSTDGGLTWDNKKIITHLPFNTIYYLTGMQTSSGRIIAFWTDNLTLVTQMVYSDNEGDSWSSATSLPASTNATWYPAVSQTKDTTIYLGYSKDVSNDFSYDNIVFRTSTDNGITWSDENILSDNPVSQNMGSIIPGDSSELLAVYSRLIEGYYGIVKRSSTDGGDSWSAETSVLDSSFNYDNTRVVRINNDTLCLLFWNWDWITGDYDFYYMISGDNGNTWGNPTVFTPYAGYDGYVSNLCLYNNKPFAAFVSDRWQNVYNIPQVWYGVIGITEDDNPPPAVLYSSAYKSFFAPGKNETILGRFADESGLMSAQVNLSLNGGAEQSLQLFDDGQHNDWGIGDGIWGIQLDPYSLEDHLDYSFSITDIDNNTINVHGFSIDVVQHGNPVNPNKGFEETPVGIVSGSNISGWFLGIGGSASAVFEVIDDTVNEGNHALKINMTTLGVNPWDIQAVNVPFPVEPEAQYRYFMWAKADKDNVIANFDVEESPSNNGWGGIEVHLTTQWQEFSFDFATPSSVSSGRSANWFGLSSNNTNLPITFYIDDLRIVKLDLSVDVENNLWEIPTEFSMSQNYPNPFNPTTTINFVIPKSSFVNLKVYDILGNEAAVLVNEEKPAGNYNLDFDASALSSGVYFYKVEAGEFVQTKKMILIR